MKIGFVRSGGFAGIRLAVDVDTNDLPLEEATQLAQLVEQAHSSLSAVPLSAPAPDRFEYQLTIDASEYGPEVHRLYEPDVPEPVRPLIDMLTLLARGKRA
jgi:hypothetical protein